MSERQFHYRAFASDKEAVIYAKELGEYLYDVKHECVEKCPHCEYKKYLFHYVT